MWTSAEVSELSGWGFNTVSRWARTGVIRPAYLGRKSIPSLYTDAMLISLTVAYAIHKSQGCNTSYIRKIWDYFVDMDEQSLCNWLAHQGDTMTEAQAAKIGDRPPLVTLPAQARTVEAVHEALRPVEAAIRVRRELGLTNGSEALRELRRQEAGPVEAPDVVRVVGGRRASAPRPKRRTRSK